MKTTKKFLVFLFCIVNTTVLFSQGLWDIPACAWTRKMGDRPVFSSVKLIDCTGLKPGTMTKKGIPLGGIGTGSFMYNFSGSFGPFYMKPGV
ncbi:MAG: hypothetical protein LBT50_05305, partial [Prevotellaceae bacterium]|nr:hypothetical protein [Prevotellaceae bacterium]